MDQFPEPIQLQDDPSQLVDVVLDGGGSGDGREPASLVNSGPTLDAIRGEGLPAILQDGMLPPHYAGLRRLASETGTETSRMTVWDRGESLYAEAYPSGRAAPDVKEPEKQSTGTLLKRLLSLRRPSSRPKGAKFYPRGSVEALMTVKEVAREITSGRSFLEQAGKPLTDDKIQEYAELVCHTESSYRKISAILILLRRGWEIVLFVDAEISDERLPLKAVFLEGPGYPPTMRLPSDPDTDLACLAAWEPPDHEGFERTQWEMLAPFLARGKRRLAWFFQLSERDVLPWISEEPAVRKGGYGWISKVEIHPMHHNFKPKLAEGSNGLFAVKHFKPDTRARFDRSPGSGHLGDGTESLTRDTLEDDIKQEFEREIEILNRFSGDVHEHLISLQAAFRHGDEYCVIFPWAEGDLKNLWMTRSPGNHLHKSDLLWVLEQCRGIASGLQNIHYYQTSETIAEGENYPYTKRIYGRHGDIKPENILLFRNQNDPNDRGRLVITDFGLTRFHSDGTKTYFTSKDVVASMTYRPPECDMEGCTISRSFDIWSLGCVLLEFMAWYLGGRALVEEFVHDRTLLDTLMFGFKVDQFFEVVRAKETTGGQVYSRVKIEVHEFVNNKLHAHPHCSDPIHRLLDFVMESMLVVEPKNLHVRAECSWVHKELDSLYKEVVDPSYKLVAAPRPTVATSIPEAVPMPLNKRAQESAQLRFSQLREHTGKVRRPFGSHLNEPGQGHSSRRAQDREMSPAQRRQMSNSY